MSSLLSRRERARLEPAERAGRIQWVSDLAEIPEDLRARFGFGPLGPADGPVKRAMRAMSDPAATRPTAMSARKARGAGSGPPGML
ncbi:hypothetical protein [Thiohalorhabdus methylotrophus]|uniref:Uncharacterized protein n=1 Tax=Thiohalorhabdus methylotrophus TaxID=3242694 RepID=A0ABV4TUG1_9GAMM